MEFVKGFLTAGADADKQALLAAPAGRVTRSGSQAPGSPAPSRNLLLAGMERNIRAEPKR